jgi:hypothetical protein
MPVNRVLLCISFLVFLTVLPTRSFPLRDLISHALSYAILPYHTLICEVPDWPKVNSGLI